MKYHEINQTRYKIILTHEQISKFCHYAEDQDDAQYLEYEQIFKNAEQTLEDLTLPLKGDKNETI